jgi:DNA processing protein
MHCPISPAGGRGLIVRREPRAESIEREVAAVRKAGARYLFHDQSDYPALLAELDSAPPNMTCRGRLALGHAPCVALDGARNASAAAVKLARDFGAALAEAGFTVVSVLARGIDGAAHEGAFPNTIGVIASGIDIAYPPQHTALQERNASEAAFSFEEPHNRRPRLGHAGGRGRAAIGLADHRAAGGRGGARGDGDPPLPTRCARWVAIS